MDSIAHIYHFVRNSAIRNLPMVLIMDSVGIYTFLKENSGVEEFTWWTHHNMRFI